MDEGPVIHRARWVVPIRGEPIKDAEIVVANGCVVEVRRATRRYAVDHGDAVILPAFVNAHCHLEYTLLAGKVKASSYVEWLSKVVELKRDTDASAFQRGAMCGALANVRAGVGAIGDFSDTLFSAKALKEVGLRGAVFQELIAPAKGTWQSRLSEVRKRAAHQRRSGAYSIRVRIAPHAPYTVVEEALAAFRGGVGAIHCAESQEEIALLTTGQGALARWLRKMALDLPVPGCSSAEYLDRLKLLKKHSLLVHCVHLSSREIGRIARIGCSVVHCPRSNRKLGVGIAPVYELLDAGVNVALGTDSLLSNTSFDMFAEMREAARQNSERRCPSLPARLLLRMATENGAAALGLRGVCGLLNEGFSADFCVVGLREPLSEAVEDIERYLVRRAKLRDVKALYVRGQRLFFSKAYRGR